MSAAPGRTADSRKWAAIDVILDAALELPPENRATLLDKACDGDPDLRREIEELLEACEREEGILDTPAVAFAASLIASEEPGSENAQPRSIADTA